MSAFGEVLVTVSAVILGILCACGLGWFVIMVIMPLGWAIAFLFVGLLGVLIALMSITKAEPPL